MSENPKSVVVIGGGITGLAVARKLLLKYGNRISLRILEKENLPGKHQSSRNSGVLHAGLAYQPGSKKALLAVSGIQQMVQFCEENDLPHEQCGKLVVARNEDEIAGLGALLKKGRANGLSGLRQLDREEMVALEPHVGGVAGLLVPGEGIADFAAVCEKLSEKIVQKGGQIVTGFKLSGVVEKNNQLLLKAKSGDEMVADYAINCAGLYADKVCEFFGMNPGLRIIPFRGDYYRLKRESQYLVKNLIYPVPDPGYPFLGVHLHRLIRGGVAAGPNAVLAFSREGYRMRDVNFRELLESVSYRGLQKFLLRHRKMVISELRSSASATVFLNRLRKLVPELSAGDLERGKSGVRAQGIDRKGNLIGDFFIKKGKNSLHLLNAPSPGATASLSIADWVVDQIEF